MGAGAARADSDSPQVALPMAFIKNLLEDSLTQFRQQIHRDVHNMHVDMIRQFQIQKVGHLSSAVLALAPTFFFESVRCLAPWPCGGVVVVKECHDASVGFTEPVTAPWPSRCQ